MQILPSSITTLAEYMEQVLPDELSYWDVFLNLNIVKARNFHLREV